MTATPRAAALAAATDTPATAPLPPPQRTRSVVSMVLQVVLIALGVFLGLAGEEWRESRENQRLGEDALRRFRAELVANIVAYDELVPAIDAALAD